MEFRQLLYAIQIAAEKNFSRAAEKLHIAQPSLSQQLSKLEKELGVLLFHRNTNSVELTHAGAVFVDKAQKIVDMVGEIRQEMDDISQLRKGKLIIGSMPITGAHMLPLVLPVFRQRYPDIEIVLIEETSANLTQLTADGRTDLSLLSLPLHEQSLEYDVLVEEEIRLAVPPDHPFASMASGDGTVDLARFEREPFVVLKKGQGLRQTAIDLCLAAGFAPRIAFESSNIETVQSLVAAGMGVAFVPAMVERGKWSENAPVYLSIASRPTRTLVIARRKGRYVSKAAEAFISTARELIGRTRIERGPGSDG
ncbi:LysR family transcriptional regulator [Paenibacillus flagellatus]|uniref:Transcriptional regulator n=1 Tax=Paenibacillus flagellatus TaxID=2211139 RepID=A0A2V5KY80_9BACL|nr:LysR family transcriptional regulator [Paenibacillus flagellatus]PYI54846.1 transcriptional regulator [Paenibacillus flagellatus]